ncbi:extracellular solute-binding protein [Halosimplex halophilum]|uniref:extracellular solute-binding protein n=1 Tax=Halosimplex halophilum TaxID=2559572 RepID=UPI00107FAD76|nr:extracellular solute-binding protein [Halosimplex halophilum]
MPTQRSAGGRSASHTDGRSGVGAIGADDDGATRRGFLTGLGAAGAVGLSAGLGGCVGSVGSVVGADGDDSDGERPVSVLAAGSLQLAFSEGLRAAVDRRVQVEAHGSVTAARLVAAGKRDPDVVALADTALFDRVLPAGWHAAFATNALVVAYDAESEVGRRVGTAERWFDPLLAGDATLGRTDPDLDPLGYRTLFALNLASEYYDRPSLRDALVDPRAVYPETSLLSRFETGDLDAAVVYRSMAEDRGYDYVDLPAELDLSDPDRADAYRAASYDLPTGETVRGGPIAYGAVARRDADRVAEAFEALVGGEYLGDHGFAVPETFPEYSGDVPRAHRP